MQGGDGGELLVVAARGGVAHAPGYPLWTLLARGFAALPVGTVAFRVTLLSALCAAGAAALVCRWALGKGASPTAAMGGALALGLSPTFWRWGGVPEVFALGALMAALLLVARRPFVVGLVFGLGLSNHHTIVLCAPIAAAALGRAPSRWLTAAAGLAVGLLPYAALALPGGAWRWGDTTTLAGLAHHFLRSDFGTFTMGGEQGAPGYARHALGYLASWPREWLLLAPAAAIGVLRAPLSLRASLALCLLFLCAMNVPRSDLGRAVAERFFVLPQLLTAACVALGLDRVLRARPRLAWMLAPALTAQALLAYPRADWRRADAVERYAEDALRVAAPGSVILGVGDLPLFSLLYAQEVRGLRRDVTYVDLHLLRSRWYHDRVRARLGELGAPFDARRTDTRALVASQIRARPVYFATPAGAAASWPGYPEGVLVRLLDGRQPAPAPAEAAERLRAFRPGGGDDAWSELARGFYARAWEAVARAREAAPLPRAPLPRKGDRQ